jgi:hypothetical protein
MVTVRMSLEAFRLTSWVERALGRDELVSTLDILGTTRTFFCRVSFYFPPFKTIYPYGIFMLALVALEV